MTGGLCEIGRNFECSSPQHGSATRSTLDEHLTDCLDEVVRMPRSPHVLSAGEVSEFLSVVLALAGHEESNCLASGGESADTGRYLDKVLRSTAADENRHR